MPVSHQTSTVKPEERLRSRGGVRVLSFVRRGLGHFFVAVSLLFLVWMVLEFVFALAHIGEDTVVRPDPLLGYFHLPEQSITFRSEGYSRSRTNALGFRDTLPGPKDPNTLRIAVLGDSMTLGLEVAPEETYPKLLEKHLRSKGVKAEVLNCGMSGSGTGQQYLLFKERIAALKPDVLLLAFHDGDSEDNVCGGTSPPRPVFSRDAGGVQVQFNDIDRWLATDEARFYSSCDEFRRSSRVWNVLSHVPQDCAGDSTARTLQKWIEPARASLWRKFLSSLPPGNWNSQARRQVVGDLQLPPATPSPAIQGFARPVTNDPSVQHGQDDIILFRGFLSAGQERTEITKSLIRLFNRDCQRINCRLVVCSMPSFDNAAFYYRELNKIEQLAADEKFDYVPAYRHFPQRAPMAASPLFFDLHFTRLGHEMMCDAIGEPINELAKRL